MKGVASTGLPVSNLLTHGDFGLGTFRNLAGEMVLYDGKLYQMTSDGSVRLIDSDKHGITITPFAAVTHFRPDCTRIIDFMGIAQLLERLSIFHPAAKNHHLAFKVVGSFRCVTVRTVGGQKFPGEGLEEVGKRQAIRTFDGPIRGTVIGFRSPRYMHGVNVGGEHLHLVSADLSQGGHVLNLESDGDVEISTMVLSAIHLQLPEDDMMFCEADLECDAAAIAAVQGTVQ